MGHIHPGKFRGKIIGQRQFSCVPNEPCVMFDRIVWIRWSMIGTSEIRSSHLLNLSMQIYLVRSSGWRIHFGCRGYSFPIWHLSSSLEFFFPAGHSKLVAVLCGMCCPGNKLPPLPRYTPAPSITGSLQVLPMHAGASALSPIHCPYMQRRVLPPDLIGVRYFGNVCHN